MTKHWATLTRFMSDGRICLSNNAAERALHGVAVGRHNWTFAGSDRGGERAAGIHTLVATAKLNGIDPQAGPPTSSPGRPIIRPSTSISLCPGGGPVPPSSAPPPEPRPQRHFTAVLTGRVPSR